ncbi:FAD/NAD(P)-binding domain-containing protein [Aspergillus campestris IBT 28561]|uniref:FAD/NAD(P)-binding domain-containing protein n=1 Tax=Aspergillus campestris (strain IBT 28561) TaxID=1392248 RepID=A0A2I1D6Z3_ASPC2|nr:FAD/NAD(P)-binding domain-containing protein [Aspergillus campestris IBT 28561]PKY05637.1 FAD/NAD(P)-binding domain-containing protein [Aspergillus campestris IBT 28561]
MSSNIVVIGGSYAGIGVCHGLLQKNSDQKITVTLINPSTEFYFNIAAPRIVAKSDLIAPEKYTYSIPEVFDKYPMGTFRFVHGIASSVDLQERNVHVHVHHAHDEEEKKEEVIAYDHLVIASGSTTPSTVGKDSFAAPFKAPIDGDLAAAVSRTQSAIRDAKTIAIGGGGPVGVEFAGEIAEAYENDATKKSITLVSGTARLLPTLPASAQDAAEQILQSKGIHLQLGKLVNRAESTTDGGWTVQLSDGTTLTVDLFISAMGTLPNSGFIPESLRDESGWVTVDEHQRVLNRQGQAEPRVYALGDITSYPDRLLLRVQPQIPIVVANVQGAVEERHTALSSYSPAAQWRVMAVPVGQRTGTGAIGSWRLSGWLVSLIKGKDFFIGKAASYIQG